MVATHAPTSPKVVGEVTELLIAWQQGDLSALEKLTPLVYSELHRLARSYMKQERGGHVLQTTALIHEAFMKLMDQSRTDWQNRAQFFAVAATLMRRILVDFARQRRLQKRGGETICVELNEALTVPERRPADLIALDDALESLSKRDERKGQVVELRFFGGLSIEDTALILDVSIDTVKRDWKAAKLWLFQELSVNQQLSN